MIVYGEAEESLSIVREENAWPQPDLKSADRVFGTEFAGGRLDIKQTQGLYLSTSPKSDYKYPYYPRYTLPYGISYARSWARQT